MPPESWLTPLSTLSLRCMKASSVGNAPRDQVGRQAEVAAVDLEVLPHRQVRIEIVLLRHEADPGALAPGRSHRPGTPNTRKAAARERGQPHDHAHRRGLAGAVGAEQADAHGRRDLEIDAADRMHGAVGFLEPFGRDHGPHGRPRSGDIFLDRGCRRAVHQGSVYSDGKAGMARLPIAARRGARPIRDDRRPNLHGGGPDVNAICRPLAAGMAPAPTSPQ